MEDIVYLVRNRALRVLDPTAELQQEVKDLDKEIGMLEKGESIIQGLAPRQGKEYYDETIQRLEEKVKSIRERPELNLDVEKMILFDKFAAKDALMKTVSIIGEPSTQMITYDKVIDLERKTKAPIEPQTPVPWGAATF